MLRLVLAGFLGLITLGCSGGSKPLQDVLPAAVDGWTRNAVRAIEPASAPDIVKQLGLKSAASASYTGPANVTVLVYEMNVSTSAFELIQKWRQQDGLAVYKGAYFIVAEPGSGAQAAGLLEALRKQLP
jgi:hypothetical protein